jgi:hypothetical protein
MNSTGTFKKWTLTKENAPHSKQPVRGEADGMQSIQESTNTVYHPATEKASENGGARPLFGPVWADIFSPTQNRG